MSGIFSNRFFQGGTAIVAIGIAFFAYQNFAGENVDTNTNITTAISEGQIEAHQVYATEDNSTENIVNKSENSDIINTVANETVE